MKILGFLQNQWFKEPDRVKGYIAAQPEDKREDYRHRFLTRSLFMGCRTGANLQRTLGGDLCKLIYWEEASREIGDRSNAIFPHNVKHIREVIVAQRPVVILALGRVAQLGVAEAMLVLSERGIKGVELVNGITIIKAPHPTSRNPDTMRLLREAVEEIRMVFTS